MVSNVLHIPHSLWINLWEVVHFKWHSSECFFLYLKNPSFALMYKIATDAGIMLMGGKTQKQCYSLTNISSKITYSE